MDVRPVGPADAPLVLALTLNSDLQLVNAGGWPESHSTIRSVGQSLFPVVFPGRAWIARDGCHAALLAMKPRQYVMAWDVTRLAVRGTADGVLQEVVKAAVTHLQSQGVPRLFARCQEDGLEPLDSLGFTPLASEYLLLGPDDAASEDASLPLDSRYRMPTDAWPLHQLEQELTPALVRQLEGLTSMDWSWKARNTVQIVVEREGKIIAWAGWRTRPRNGLLHLGMLVHPAHTELSHDLLGHALKSAPQGSRFVARVRKYHSETLTAFLQAGFQIVSEETLMVKHAGVETVQLARQGLRMVSVPSMHILQSPIGPGRPGIAHMLRHKSANEDSKT